MICTVSTVKDDVANLERFVGRNLSSGADHMFLFLDDADEAVRQRLLQHPHVTAIATDAAYWNGRRPDDLNLRQIINANLANTLLCPFDWVDWLFHIDGDECLDLDKERLAGLDEGIGYVRLEPREALSRRHWDGEVTHFKRLLGTDELHLLTALGVITEPRNLNYFNGHVAGKVGVRPGLDVRMSIHRADRHGAPDVEAFRADFLHLLHYESHSGDEFVRKWARHIGSGTATRFKPERMRLRSAIMAVQNNETLSEDRRRHYLAELYRRHIEDQADTLMDLGYLVEPDERLHAYRPKAFTQAQRRLHDKLLDRLIAVHKDMFRLANVNAGEVLRTVRSQLGYVDRGLAARIDSCLAREREPEEADGSTAGQGSA